MRTMWGADPDALDHLAVQIGQWARVLASYRVTLNAGIHGTPWYGQEADRFRHDWDNGFSRDLLATAEALATAEGALRRNADEQRRASSSGGNVAPGIGPTGGPRDSGLDHYFDDVAGPIGLASGLALITQTLVKERVARGAIKDADSFGKQFAKFEHDVPAPLDRFARVLQVGSVWNDSAKTLYDIEHGDVSASDVGQLVWDGGSFVPIVGEMEGAWGIGSGIGSFLANRFHTADAIWNLASGSQGDIYNDPAAAHQLVERYSGWSGPIHAGADAVDGIASKTSKWFSSL